MPKPKRQAKPVRRWVSVVGGGGRVVVPAELRGKLGIKPGDKVIFGTDGEQVRIISPTDALRDLQKKYGEHWSTAVTADRAWSKLDIGVSINVFR